LQYSQPSQRRKIYYALGFLIVVMAAVFIRGAMHHVAAAEQKAPPPPPVTATLGVATAQELPIYALGIGNVQANYSVTVHARVNGQLVTVAYKEGQDIKQGDLLAQIDPAPYRAAYQAALAQTARDQANYENALVDLKRYSTLSESDSIAQQTLDTQRATVAQAKATVEVDRAQADAAKVNLDYTTIRSPLSGRAGLRLVDPGNIVQTSDTTGLVVINQIDPISVIFTLPEGKFELVNRAMAKQSGPLTVEAYAREDNTLLARGKLVLINNQIDSSTGTVQLKATFTNTNHQLWPGEYVNVHIITSTSSVVTVPSMAIQRGNAGLFLWTVNADDVAALTPVKELFEQDGLAVIDGVPAGTRVVTDGQYRLKAGVKVVAQSNSAAAPKS
jgi:multidrug efflux system membrane fusion protein